MVIAHSMSIPSTLFYFNNKTLSSPILKRTGFSMSCRSCSVNKSSPNNKGGRLDLLSQNLSVISCPCCARRQFLGAVFGSTTLIPMQHSFAQSKDSSPSDDPKEVLKRVRPPRPDWYEELYASALDKLMDAYEEEIADRKSRLFADLKGKAETVLEVGIGTGPNLKYYADIPSVTVYGVDPNTKMEKYARKAAEANGIPLTNFKFMLGVAEALPVDDASVDAVIGTLVLCSVNDVDKALQEVLRVLKPGGYYIFVEHVAAKAGTLRRIVQNVLDPVQQFVGDGCHLTRNTASNIYEAGFSNIDMDEAVLSTTSFINPQIYGMARK